MAANNAYNRETTMFDLDDMDDNTASDATAVDADSEMEAIEASIERSLKVLNDNEKPKKLTMQLIRQSVSMAVKQSARRLVTDEIDDDETPESAPIEDQDGDDEIDSLLQKKILRLDWMSLQKIENLEAFTHIQELYLQHNLIEKIENLDDHHELSFLALGGNRIQRVTGLKHLTNLKFLDLSNNAIDDFDIREFPPSLVILRLAGNPFTRHMPAYMHLFFERLPSLKQVDQYRRVPVHLTEDSPVGTPQPLSPLSFSPRSQISELAMEVEMSEKQHSPRPRLPTEEETEPVANTNDSTELFDSDEYAQQKLARMAKWKQQLQDLETRQHEFEVDMPMITRSTNGAAIRARRKKVLENAREAIEAAIADSMAHFQQMELQHHEWQERQHQAAKL